VPVGKARVDDRVDALGLIGSEMSNRMPLPEQAPAAIFSSGKTVMSWQ
jgi:hypothetical protein